MHGTAIYKSSDTTGTILIIYFIRKCICGKLERWPIEGLRREDCVWIRYLPPTVEDYECVHC